jgi:hypothetical protein
MRYPFSTGKMHHSDNAISIETGSWPVLTHDVCFPSGPDTMVSYHTPIGGSTIYCLLQWYVSDNPAAINGLACDTLAGMNWRSVGAPEPLMMNSEGNNPNYIFLPTQLPPLNGPVVQSTEGAYRVLTYKLLVTPVKSFQTLEPICVGNYLLGSFNYCGSYTVAGPGCFMADQQVVRVFQCSNSARYDERASDNSLQKSQLAKLDQVYPNPANEVLNVAYTLPIGTSNARMVLYSISGQIVDTFQIQGDATNTAQFDVSRLSAGIYTASLEVDGMVIGNRRISITH